ncbi:MAG: hypothetical protein HYS58_00455 [Elusimicrobia bacterium]|nr:hypothetical protein [Elusimicrobiota bacterium]
MEKLLFSRPVKERNTKKKFIFGSIQEKDYRTHFVMVFSEEGVLEQTLDQDEEIEQLLKGRRFEISEGWQLKELRTEKELWPHFLVLPYLDGATLQFKRNSAFDSEHEAPLILIPVYKELFDFAKSKLPRPHYSSSIPIGSIFYPLRKLWPIYVNPVKVKRRIQNFIGWLGEPLVIAPRWETVLFPLAGFLVYAYGAAIGSPGLMHLGLGWATLGFSFSHTIVEWIARAIKYPDTFTMLLMEKRRSVLEIFLLDIKDFAIRFVLSLLFLLPYIAFDPFSATVLTIFAHTHYNLLKLSGQLPSWMPVAAIARPGLKEELSRRQISHEKLDQELLLQVLAYYVKDNLEEMKYNLHSAYWAGYFLELSIFHLPTINITRSANSYI